MERVTWKLTIPYVKYKKKKDSGERVRRSTCFVAA